MGDSLGSGRARVRPAPEELDARCRASNRDSLRWWHQPDRHHPHAPGHSGPDQTHDVYVEIAGPAASDVHHNFVLRWNEASERHLPDGSWGHAGDFPFPATISLPRGTSQVQIQRNIHRGRYRNSTPTPGGEAFAISEGEYAITEQYLLAIDAARDTIYIENQAIPTPIVCRATRTGAETGGPGGDGRPGNLDAAAQRSTPTTDRTPAIPGPVPAISRWLVSPVRTTGRQSSDVYVHSKVMIVDGCWATIGSCNLHAHSLGGNSELNASIWDPQVAHALQDALFREHVGIALTGLDDIAMFGEFRKVATENGQKRASGNHQWQGLAFAIDPATYGT